MFVLEDLGLLFAIACAFAAIVLGRNLTRSIVAASGSLGGLGFALLVSGAGLLGLVLVVVAALTLGIVQIFGWMLVDVDRDHLPPTDRPTWIARSLAFLLIGGGLVLLIAFAAQRGELGAGEGFAVASGAKEIGSVLFGARADATGLLGFAIAANLVGCLMLLRDDAGRD
jgi:NADH:ubiquinone oxidoreductase subunit 6 (subunit J)